MRGGAFTPAVRAAVLEATAGQCAGCGRRAAEVHHRCPRGAGGTSRASVGAPFNGIALCQQDHSWAESYRDHARQLGWLLTDPDPAAPWWAYGWGWRAWVEVDGCWLTAYVDASEPAVTPPVAKVKGTLIYRV